MTITWLGQGADPGEAAGEAAKDEALKAEWPPTKGNAQAIGAAAGAAAATAGCAAAGAATAGVTTVLAATGVCGLIGSEIGAYIGGAIYAIVDGFFGGEVYVAPQFDLVIYRRTRAAAGRLASLRSGNIANTTEDFNAELEALYERGVPRGAGSPQPPPEIRAYYNRDGLTQFLRLIAAAESQRSSEIITARRLAMVVRPGVIIQPLPPSGSAVPPPSGGGSSAAPLLIGAAIAAGLAWLALS